MRDDDRHVGEIHRDVVDMDRLRVFQAQSAAAAHAGAHAGMAGVEDRGQLMLGDHLVELVGLAVIGEEARRSDGI